MEKDTDMEKDIELQKFIMLSQGIGTIFKKILELTASDFLFFLVIIRLWNHLPQQVKSCDTITGFKNALEK